MSASTDWIGYVNNELSPVEGKLIEIGEVISLDREDGKEHVNSKSILVQFDSVEDIRRALDEGICKFKWL